jgi:DNA-binding response OmpR family regulator
MRILLLEDQPATRRGLATILEREGHTVLVAQNALEAQALCAEGDPDVAIVDIQLPGLQGNEWALHLREVSPDTRIIFVSGRHGLAGLDRYGPDVHFLHKPFAPSELLDLINEKAAVTHA